MFRVIIFFAGLTACGVLSATTRQGFLNQYYIYTNTDFFNVPFQLTENNINSSPLDFSRNTTVIVHGHDGSGFTGLNPLVKNSLLNSEDANVLVIDWSVYAAQSYSNALAAVPRIAQHIANIITLLVENTIATDDPANPGSTVQTEAPLVAFRRLHLVGFDLGAHIVGFVGRQLNGRVQRITGLNPSTTPWGSNFEILRRSDARYVEVIHTDGGGLLSNGIGEVMGHADFFVNGGSNQPGCLANNSCSHNRAWELFAASLGTNHLVGRLCGSWVQVSLNNCRGATLALGNNNLIKYGSGTYRANTGRTFPF